MIFSASLDLKNVLDGCFSWGGTWTRKSFEGPEPHKHGIKIELLERHEMSSDQTGCKNQLYSEILRNN